MTEFSHHSDYDEMQREMQALRKRIEDLEAHRRRPFMRWSWRWLPIAAAVLLVLGVLGAQNQNKPDALYIAPNGNVGINQTSPSETLDVNGTAVIRDKAAFQGDLAVGKNMEVTGNAVVRGQLQAKGVIPPANSQKLPDNSGVIIGNSDIYFANTPHDHTAQGNQLGFAAIENDSSDNYKALMILGRTRNSNCPPCDRVVELMDKLGIGKPNPQAPLDVKGEIRGRPWLENKVFEVGGNGGSVKMTKVDHSVCFLTYVRGKFAGIGEWVEVVSKNDNYWYLQTGQGGGGADIFAKARCIGAPDDSW